MKAPGATYRIQFTPSFGFREARTIVKYLADLGVSHIYASPVFKARKGSRHGYNIVDPNAINPELGGKEEFEFLTDDVKKLGLSWLQDIVPNHLAFDSENRMLMDIMENGPGSPYYEFFDIQWDYPSESMRGRLLAPFLGKLYSECLESGEIKIQFDRQGLSVNYYELRLPIRIESYSSLFTLNLDRLEERLGATHPDFIKYIGTIHTLPSPPGDGNIEPDGEQIAFVKSMLWELYQTNQQIKEYIDQNIIAFNGDPQSISSFNLMDDMLSEQRFRLSFWKFANEEINYRRFFTINELISLRMEDEEVFNNIHRLLFELLRDGKITGLRIDHVDGLYDPSGYLKRLRSGHEDLFIVVEKILASDENLPSDWPVQGTTGYDFLNHLNGVFIRDANHQKFDSIYTRFIGSKTSPSEVAIDKKRLITGKHLAGNIDNLARCLKHISSQDRYGRDITSYGLKRALVEVMAHFPVYRTYLSHHGLRNADEKYIKEAVAGALKDSPGFLYELIFIEKFMLMAFRQGLPPEILNPVLDFMMQFQQISGALMAKGYEDTLFYVYNRFISLNEVGGQPGRFGITRTEFHNFNIKRNQNYPHSMSATTTHDTKKSEDVRARLNVLSELPEEWDRQVREWKKINSTKKRKVGGLRVPDNNDEYFLYQTLVGSYPFDDKDLPDYVPRIKEYAVKAVREAKIHTAWLKPSIDYEDAYVSFIETILRSSPDNDFLRLFLPFQRKIAHYGCLNSLSQTLLKITAPGLPDFYQGSELWDLRLVDPDNRGPVDFEKRISLLNSLTNSNFHDSPDQIKELLARKEDGRVKLFLIHRALKTRNSHLRLFQEGGYIPLTTKGRHENHLICFARNFQNSWGLVIAPRWLTALAREGDVPMGEDVWGDTTILLPEGLPEKWTDSVTGKEISGRGLLSAGAVLSLFPVAMLMNEEKS